MNINIEKKNNNRAKIFLPAKLGNRISNHKNKRKRGRDSVFPPRP